jgi:hypothetical protein
MLDQWIALVVAGKVMIFFPGFAGMGPIVPSRGQGPGDHLVGCLLSINYQG